MMSKRVKPMIAILLLALVIAAAPATAQGTPETYAIHIHAGTCDGPGDIVVPLTDLTAPAGERTGPDAATNAATSYSSVPLALDVLLAQPHAIDVHRAVDGAVIACGEIGGVPDANGAVSVGLRPANGSGFSGIAYLGPQAGNPSQTGISAFLAETGGTAVAPAQPLEAATYAAAVRAQISLTVGSLQRVDTLFDAPDPADQAWLTQLNAEMALWHILYGEAQGLVPPPELADFHIRYVEALALLDSAALDITEALATGDQARLTQADAKIDEAIAALRALDRSGSTATPAATPATGT